MNSGIVSLQYRAARAKGITLIELMIVVTVIGALTMLTIPAFRGYTERAHRVEALSAMARIVVEQEKFRNANDTYSDDPEELGFEGNCTENCVYLIEFIGTPDTVSFKARFTPNPDGGANGVNQTRDESCSWFTVDEADTKEAENDTCLAGR